MRSRPKPPILIVAALATLLAIAAPVAASSRSPVGIDVLTHIDAGVDDFDTTGDLLCPSGDVENDFVLFVGGQSNTHAQILIRKHFVCDDDSGTFDILLRVSLSFETQETEGTWSVVDGTEAYEKLHGNGTLVGTPQGGDSILDIYTGTLHVD